MKSKIIKKIIDYKDKDIFIIFYSDWCQYSKGALELLKKNDKSFKGYNIDNIKGGIKKLLKDLRIKSNEIEFDLKHSTRPMLFKNGKFIGGYTELKEFLKFKK